MAVLSGLRAQIGFATESTVNTPVAPTLFLPYRDESLLVTPGRAESSARFAGRRTMDSSQWNGGVNEVGGDVGLELYDRGLGRIFRHMFGSVVTTGAGPYTHTFTPGDLSGLAFTTQVGVPGDGSVVPKTLSGCKVASWEMAFAAGEYTTLGLSIVGQSYHEGSRVVTDGVTTSGDATVTSATAAFTTADIGKPISGTGIPAGTKVRSINSATSIELTANATASGTGVSLTIGLALATASYPSGLKPLKFNMGTIALNSVNQASVYSGSISGDNALNTDRAVIGSTDVLEPIENDIRDYSFALTVQYENDGNYKLMQAGAEVPMSLGFSLGANSVTITTNVRIDQASTGTGGGEVVQQEIAGKCIGSGTDSSAITAVLVNSDASAS